MHEPPHSVLLCSDIGISFCSLDASQPSDDVVKGCEEEDAESSRGSIENCLQFRFSRSMDRIDNRPWKKEFKRQMLFFTQAANICIL